MNGLIAFVTELVVAIRHAYKRKWSFLGLFAVAFLTSVALLAQADLLPDAPKSAAAIAAVASATTTPVAQVAVAELPAKIEIPDIKLSATISNPTSTDLHVLDNALLKGAVRYPTSAKLGEVGNVVLFGHSSYLPVVGNQAYKTFDDIQKLKVGAVVNVLSGGTVYTYQVRVVEKKSANDGAIPLSVAGRVLTLSTCNSFGEKSDRFVVTADFVESHPAST